MGVPYIVLSEKVPPTLLQGNLKNVKVLLRYTSVGSHTGPEELVQSGKLCYFIGTVHLHLT